MKRTLLTLTLALATAACGGGPLGPSLPGSAGAIEGTWRGTITFTKPAPLTVQMEMRFTPIASTSGHGFQAQASWNGVSTRAMNATVIGTLFSTNGSYPSPRGCDGIVGGDGTVEGDKIDASFQAISSCDAVFEGHMILSR